jgi:hypothetical protein
MLCDHKVDVYAFGIMIWEVVTGQSWYRFLQRKFDIHTEVHSELQMHLKNSSITGSRELRSLRHAQTD